MSKNSEVDKFLNKNDIIFTKEINYIRKIILNVNSDISEAIKWNAPTFIYKGNIATFNLRSKKYVNLTFHEGATLDDPYNILEGKGKKARIIRFRNFEDIEAKTEAVQILFKNWIKLKDK